MKGIPAIILKRWRVLVIYVPLIFGAILLLYLRGQGGFDHKGILPIALLLIACPCLLYAVLPGVGQISPDQVAALNQLGIRYRPWMGRTANGLTGLILLLISITSLAV